jgi:hypothetical protein
MGYAAIAVAIFGFVLGLKFRLKILLLFVGFTLLASIVFSIGSGFGVLNTFLTIMAAQTIFQSSYFLGLVVRAILHAPRARHVF